jgi:nicotinamide mononucleotide adenylyltransferase
MESSHLQVIRCILGSMQAGYDVLGGYLSPVNANYSKDGLISSSDRLALAQAAVQGSDWLMVDSWELNQPDFVPTLQVLQSIQRRLDSALQVAEVSAPLRNERSDRCSFFF